MTQQTAQRVNPASRTKPSAARSVNAPRDELGPTKNDLPEDTRREAVMLLNQRLAECLDLAAQCKQAHWNVKGPSFIALHKLFDEVYAGIQEYADLIAERVVQLGGTAAGTVGVVAERSELPDYPVARLSGHQHVAALSDALAAFGRAVRVGIEELEELADAGSVDILTEISRGTDKWLWFVEAHQQGG